MFSKHMGKQGAFYSVETLEMLKRSAILVVIFKMELKIKAEIPLGSGTK
jgi:hypothetical protein